MTLLVGDMQRTDSPKEAQSLRSYLTVGQLAAVLAAGIHAAVVPEHLQESLLIGSFFVVVAIGQFGLAAALRRRPPLLVVVAAIWAHVGLIALYVASRTVDLPFLPPHHGASSVQHLPVAGGHGNGIPAYPAAKPDHLRADGSRPARGAGPGDRADRLIFSIVCAPFRASAGHAHAPFGHPSRPM